MNINSSLKCFGIACDIENAKRRFESCGVFSREINRGRFIELAKEYVPKYSDCPGIPDGYTFGIEIEYANLDYDVLRAFIYPEESENCEYVYRYDSMDSAGVLTRVIRHDMDREEVIERYWGMRNEDTVPGGGEAISPVLSDDIETWKEIRLICAKIAERGGIIDDRCAGHVHVGMWPLGYDVKKWTRLYQIWRCYEDIVFRLSGGEQGRLRDGCLFYATPVSPLLRDFSYGKGFGAGSWEKTWDDIMYMAKAFSGLKSRGYESEYLAQRGIIGRHFTEKTLSNSLNIDHLCDKDSKSNKPTVEFKTFNGTLNPVQWQTNVIIACGIVEAAAELGEESPGSSERVAILERENRYMDTYGYKYNPNGDIGKVLRFLDVVFKDLEKKIRVLNLWLRNKEMDMRPFYEAAKVKREDLALEFTG